MGRDALLDNNRDRCLKMWSVETLMIAIDTYDIYPLGFSGQDYLLDISIKIF